MIDNRQLLNIKNKLSSAAVLKNLQSCIQNKELSKEDLKTLLSEDGNLIDVRSALYLLKEGFLLREDFVGCGIDKEFIDLVEKEQTPIDPSDGTAFVPIESIAPNATEVYFWGVPSSGKSCALGAVMSVANGSDYVMIQDTCQGRDYMNRLSSLFEYDGCYTFLPQGTRVTNTYEMRFSLTQNDKEHPLAFIDLSGELFTCLYKKQVGDALSDEEGMAFDTLKTILVEHASKNRKIHFFVIEYGGEDRLFNGLKPDVYLQRAAEYLDSLGVFTEYTDAIYIILTKADRVDGFFSYTDDVKSTFHNYMSNNYFGFYKALRKMCKTHSINGGKLEFVPFSIGKVCLRRLCRFDSSSAKEILNIIVDRSFYYEKSRWGNVKKWLRK